MTMELLKGIVEDVLSFYDSLSYKNTDEYIKGATYAFNFVLKQIEGWTPEDIIQLAASMDYEPPTRTCVISTASEYEPDDTETPEEIELTKEQAETIAKQANEEKAKEDRVRDLIMSTFKAWIEQQNLIRSLP